MKDDSLWRQVIDKRNFTLAWQRLRANMGAPGIDRITVDEFAANLESNLCLVRQMVADRSYEPLPLLTFTHTKGNKTRTLHIPALRDRLVQYALLQIIQPVVDKKLLSCSYAYRSGKSASKAADKVERWIKKGRTWFFSADIENFFDTIDRRLLQSFLARQFDEDTLIELILKPVLALETSSGLGIPQGMILSPLLSNIYLNEFDALVQSDQWNYIRYSDNLLVLASEETTKSEAAARIQDGLKQVHLALNSKKTFAGKIEKGFVFLGFHFNLEGRRPAPSAWQHLQENLRHVLDHPDAITKEKMNDKVDQIIRGWTNYFHLNSNNLMESAAAGYPAEQVDGPIGSALLRAAVMIKQGDFAKAHEALAGCQEPIQSAEINWQWGLLCQCLGLESEARDVFIAALRENPDHAETALWLGMLYLRQGQLDKAIRFLQKAVGLQPQLGFAHYALGMALKKYHLTGAALKSFHQAIALDPSLQRIAEDPIFKSESDRTDYPFTQRDLEQLQQTFKGREGVFAKQWLNTDGRIGYTPQFRALTMEDWAGHLRGQHTLGLYLVRSDQTAFHLVLDFDLNKQVQSEFIKKESDRQLWMNLVLRAALQVKKQTDQHGLPGYLEDSGAKGLHVWYFFSEPIPVKDLLLFCKRLAGLHGPLPEGVNIESLPRKETGDKGMGSLIKLPFGVHQASGRRCLFLDSDGRPHTDWLYPMPSLEQISSNHFYQILQQWSRLENTQDADPEQALNHPDVQALFKGCRVLHFLFDKAQKHGRLSHVERLTFLGVVGFMGELGKEVLHAVMRQTTNYSHRITERWLLRLKSNPLSCPRIRQWHHEITPSIGCFCQFTLSENNYPSPLLHCGERKYSELLTRQAIQTLAKEIPTPAPATTLPAREEPATNSAEPTPEVLEPDVELLVRQLLKIKADERKVQKRLQALQEKLNIVFEKRGLVELPTPWGCLRRQVRSDKTTWILEI